MYVFINLYQYDNNILNYWIIINSIFVLIIEDDIKLTIIMLYLLIIIKYHQSCKLLLISH